LKQISPAAKRFTDEVIRQLTDDDAMEDGAGIQIYPLYSQFFAA
jgi:hypothetical protein